MERDRDDQNGIGYEQAVSDRDQYHHGNLREALVVAALDLMAESGVQGLSLRAVARRAGVSQAAPYHHFESKEALVAELCCRGFAELSRRTCSALSCLGSPLDRLRAMAHAYVTFATERPDLFGVMWGGKGLIVDKTPYVELTRTAGGSFEQLLQVIVDGMDAGELRRGDPIDAALAAWSAVHGVAVLIQDGAFDNPSMVALGIGRARAIDAALETVILGLGSAPAAPARRIGREG